MPRVCQEWFPETDGFVIDGYLKETLDIYAKNVIKDWDWLIIVSGSGMVRVGKSVIALQLCVYWSYLMWKLHNIKVPFDLNNIVFDGVKLIEVGNRLGINHPYSALLYDEAGSDLEASKSMRSATKAVKDFLRECGQYNLLVVLVLPEYFDLPKGIAINRSHCLINVDYETDDKDMFERGYFKFYSRPKKKMLYMEGKKYLNYNATMSDFYGKFPNFYPIDEESYRKAKIEALKRREVLTNKEQRLINFSVSLVKYLYHIQKRSFVEITDIANDNGAGNISSKYVERLYPKDRRDSRRTN